MCDSNFLGPSSSQSKKNYLKNSRKKKKNHCQSDSANPVGQLLQDLNNHCFGFWFLLFLFIFFVFCFFFQKFNN
jgi:hypothetical protein